MHPRSSIGLPPGSPFFHDGMSDGYIHCDFIKNLELRAVFVPESMASLGCKLSHPRIHDWIRRPTAKVGYEWFPYGYT